jgi:hypothetical protein
MMGRATALAATLVRDACFAAKFAGAIGPDHLHTEAVGNRPRLLVLSRRTSLAWRLLRLIMTRGLEGRPDGPAQRPLRDLEPSGLYPTADITAQAKSARRRMVKSSRASSSHFATTPNGPEARTAALCRV